MREAKALAYSEALLPCLANENPPTGIARPKTSAAETAQIMRSNRFQVQSSANANDLWLVHSGVRSGVSSQNLFSGCSGSSLIFCAEVDLCVVVCICILAVTSFNTRRCSASVH